MVDTTINGMTLSDEGRGIVERLGGRWTRKGGMCRCPAHADGTPSLSVRAGRTRLLLHCFAGCAAADILAELKALGLLGRIPAPDADASSVADAATSLSRAATRIWTDARIISGTPAEHYLLGRSIRTTSSEVRYHPRAPHGPKPLTQFRPALVAAVRDDSGVVGIHRTFLDRRTGELAKLPDPKCSLGPFGTGAVRIGGVHGIAAHHIIGQPTFARVHVEIDRHLSGRTTVAHSCFDKGALGAACRVHGRPVIETTWLDSVRVAKRAWPDLPNHKLSGLARYLGIPHRHHDALSDARAAGWVVVKAIDHTGMSLADWMAPPRRPGPAPRTDRLACADGDGTALPRAPLTSTRPDR